MKTGFVIAFLVLGVVYLLSRISMKNFLEKNKGETSDNVSAGLLIRVVMLGGLPTIGLILAIIVVLLF